LRKDKTVALREQLEHGLVEGRVHFAEVPRVDAGHLADQHLPRNDCRKSSRHKVFVPLLDFFQVLVEKEDFSALILLEVRVSSELL